MVGSLREDLRDLYSENIVAKIWRTAVKGLSNNNPPTAYPEYVPQSGSNRGQYVLREADFWTCGFFPGLLALCLERSIKFPQAFPGSSSTIVSKANLQRQFEQVLWAWEEPIHDMATRTDTHDMAFIIQPALRTKWELTGDKRSFESVMTAARSLYTRYNGKVGAIRSWDVLDQQKVKITSQTEDFLVIVDSMVNLDLLFYASKHLSDASLADAAVAHARTLIRTHCRPETLPGKTFATKAYSTRHVVNFSPITGQVKQNMTAQGYNEASTWARGLGWAVLGYAQTYIWSKDTEFLDVSSGLAEYFLYRLQSSPGCVERSFTDSEGVQRTCGRYVPLWDFDAPIEDEKNPLRDSSAGIIAANGMLVLSQAFSAKGDSALSRRYLDAAITVVKDTLDFALATEKARFTHTPGSIGDIAVEDVEAGRSFDAILKHATANHNSRDHKRYWDHGLVYGDYYLIEFANKLLRMGLV